MPEKQSMQGAARIKPASVQLATVTSQKRRVWFGEVLANCLPALANGATPYYARPHRTDQHNVQKRRCGHWPHRLAVARVSEVDGSCCSAVKLLSQLGRRPIMPYRYRTVYCSLAFVPFHTADQSRFETVVSTTLESTDITEAPHGAFCVQPVPSIYKPFSQSSRLLAGCCCGCCCCWCPIPVGAGLPPAADGGRTTAGCAP
jgi:hypothetical protein